MIPIIDMHCDTISELHNARLMGEKNTLFSNDLSIDLGKMKKGGYLCQNFALFTYMGAWNGTSQSEISVKMRETYPTPYEYALALSDTLDQEILLNQSMIRPALTANDIRENYRNGYMSAFKTLEEAAVFGGNVDHLKEFYKRGVRMTTLVWNFPNELAYPNKRNWDTGEMVADLEHGLTRIGKNMVEACMDLGILVDISHLNDAGIRDVFDIMGRQNPIVASHSNARAVTNHPRNLTDDMLKKLAENGGVTGINFASIFMNDRKDNMTRIDDMIRHIKHIENVAGLDCIGLGSDFDGIENKVEISDGSHMQALAQALEQVGYGINAIEKIFYRNVLRLYEEVL